MFRINVAVSIPIRYVAYGACAGEWDVHSGNEEWRV